MIMETNRLINLSTYSKDELNKFINQFDVIICDCDGVLYLEGTVIDNANKFINNLIENDKKVYFLTNNSVCTREEIFERYQKLEFHIKLENILSIPYLTAKYLNSLNFDKKAFVIGCENVGKELEKFRIEHIGIGEDAMVGTLDKYLSQNYRLDPNVGAVIVSLDWYFSFAKLLKAMNYLQDENILFLATNGDDRSEFPGFVFPDSGPFIAAIESASRRKATLLGKPSTTLCGLIDLPENKDKILMIGDRLNIDIAFGNNAGFKTLLVETGYNKMEDVEKELEKIKSGISKDENLIPDYVISSLGKFL